MVFFSVIISVYNKEKCIKNTIESVLNQSFKDFEVIVINDGSTDNSQKIIQSFKDKRIKLITTKNQGASKARNTGIQEASANFIALLDGDDTWEGSYLQDMHNAIRTFPKLEVFTCGISQKYENKTVPVTYSFEQKDLYGKHNFFEASKKYALITSSSIVFNKNVLIKTGIFDTSIVSGQDTDLWIRFGLHYDILFINKRLVYYNFNSSSLSNTTFELTKKLKFDKYVDEEKQNKNLKVFLDRNRYSMAILSKLQNDQSHFDYYSSHLNSNNLSLRQRLLLKSPKWLLKLLLKIIALKGEKIYYPNN